MAIASTLTGVNGIRRSEAVSRLQLMGFVPKPGATQSGEVMGESTGMSGDSSAPTENGEGAAHTGAPSGVQAELTKDTGRQW